MSEGRDYFGCLYVVAMYLIVYSCELNSAGSGWSPLSGITVKIRGCPEIMEACGIELR
jgi:hypothetical protein